MNPRGVPPSPPARPPVAPPPWRPLRFAPLTPAVRLNDGAARNVQRAWREHRARVLTRLIGSLRERCRCVVCGDECVRLVRCSNGHASCVGCSLAASDARCPLCRVARDRTRVDFVTPAVLAECGARLRCSSCGRSTTVQECERHRAWCPAHRYVCPFDACTHTCPADEMAHHVTAAHGVPSLSPRQDGCHHIVTTSTMRPFPPRLIVVGDTVVSIAQSWQAHSLRRGFAPTTAETVHVMLRGHYASCDAPVVRVTVRQLRAVDAQWSEEHRCGVVAPVVAPLEHLPPSAFGTPTVVVTPRCVLTRDDDEADVPLVLPDAAPTDRSLRERLMRSGVRDPPLSLDPLAHVDASLPVVVLHFTFWTDMTHSVGDVFEV